MAAGSVLLLNPPIWNPYAPHLAVPLLTAVMSRHGWTARGRDISMEQIDWLLSSDGLKQIGGRLEGRYRRSETRFDPRTRNALAVLPSTLENIGAARHAISTLGSLEDPDLTAWAARTIRNACLCISGSFDGLSFDLKANTGFYASTRSADVLAAACDPERNLYAWTLEHQPLDGLAAADLSLVGLSVSADTQLTAAITLARHVRLRRPDVHIVMGGNFTTRMVGRWSERHPFFDWVDSFVLYEGESALPALADTLTGQSSAPVPGLVDIDRHGNLTRTPTTTFDLSQLPVPDFSGMPLDRYLAPSPILPVLSSRSCAWDCAFCSIPFASNNFRMRQASDVAAEIDTLYERHGTQHFMFVDEIMTLKGLKDLSRELALNDRSYRWYGETRISKGLDTDLARELHAAGCRRLDLGLESYSQPVLDAMRKGIRVEDVKPAVDSLLAAGISVHLFTMTGFPGETREQAKATQAFVRDTLARSREVFGVEHSTAANGPFILDVLSPVGQRPLDFGVVLIAPDPEDDLRFDSDYRVVTGLDARQAADLALDTERPSGDLPHDGPAILDAEEWTFLRASTNLVGLSAGEPRSGLAADAVVLYPREKYSLADEVTAVERAEDCTYYVPSTDAFLVGPSLGDATPSVLARFADLGILRRDQWTSAAASSEDCLLTAHAALETDVGDDGSCAITLPDGRSVRLGAASRLFWRLVGRSPMSLSALVGASGLGQERVEPIVQRLMEAGCCVRFIDTASPEPEPTREGHSDGGR